MSTTMPNNAPQRFEGLGKPGEGFTGGKGLVNNQTESAGADEPTAAFNPSWHLTAASRSCSNRRAAWPPSLSSGRLGVHLIPPLKQRMHFDQAFNTYSV